ncbi:MarR family winged helix-turn-helix transcriptional regulator [Kribbella endophytica]
MADKPTYFPQLVASRPDIALCRAATQVIRAGEAHAASQGLGAGHQLVLKMLSEVGPTSQQALSEGLRIDRSVMVTICDELERTSCVRRERNPQDRRSYAVTLTETGRARLKEADAAVPEFLDRTFEPLSAAERRQLSALLGKLLGV